MSARSARGRSILVAYGVAALLGAGLAGCGKKPSKGGGGGPSLGKIAAAFQTASARTGVPLRLLQAIAYSESEIVPTPATANYQGFSKDDAPVARGTVVTQTAFGITAEELGLDPAAPETAELPTQIDAYADWLAAHVQGMNLSANPATAEDMYYWIENVSLLQRQGLNRPGLPQRRNVQVIFANELIERLNTGFTWQDAASGERIELAPAHPKLEIKDFPENAQSWFSLTPQGGWVFNAMQLKLVTTKSPYKNTPKRVEVIHCPLSLSACLELQSRSEDSDVHLAAHIMIPAMEQLGPGEVNMFGNKAIQVAEPDEGLVETNDRGEDAPITDAIVVMLVGNSGRPVGGVRKPANPSWFTNPQLMLMAQVIQSVCTQLTLDTQGAVVTEECMRMGNDEDAKDGVRFRHQEGSEEYRWGQIADYDPTIFGAYLASPGGLASSSAFDASSRGKTFQANQQVPLTATFTPSARSLEVERLRRCRDGRVVWEPVHSQTLRGEPRVTFSQAYYDSGPNENGEQFFRARVYGKDEALQSWSIDRVYLTGYDKEPAYATSKYCN